MAKTVNAKRIEFRIGQDIYRMDLYKNGKVLMYKKINNVFDFVAAKEIILAKLRELNPSQYSISNMSKRNTRFVGRKLYALLGC